MKENTQNKLIIELIEKHGYHSVVPQRKRLGDAAYDLYSPSMHIIRGGQTKAIPLGFKVQLPEGYCALIIERSGHAKNNSIHSIGPLIDPNYRGEVHAILHNSNTDYMRFNQGDRLAQMLVIPYFTEEPIVDKVDESERGELGLGSSGNK